MLQCTKSSMVALIPTKRPFIKPSTLVTFWTKQWTVALWQMRRQYEGAYVWWGLMASGGCWVGVGSVYVALLYVHDRYMS
jgi:hypothetical protein